MCGMTKRPSENSVELGKASKLNSVTVYALPTFDRYKFDKTD